MEPELSQSDKAARDKINGKSGLYLSEAKGVIELDRFKVTQDQKIYLGEKEITHCTGFKVIVNAGDNPEVELRVIVESADIQNYQVIPKQGDLRPAESRKKLADTIRNILTEQVQVSSSQQQPFPTERTPNQGEELHPDEASRRSDTPLHL